MSGGLTGKKRLRGMDRDLEWFPRKLQSNIQVSSRYLEKFQSATNKNEQAVVDLLISEKMDVNLKMAYTNKLTQQ